MFHLWECDRVCQSALEGPGVFWSLSKCAGVCQSAFECVGVCQSVSECWSTVECVTVRDHHG